MVFLSVEFTQKFIEWGENRQLERTVLRKKASFSAKKSVRVLFEIFLLIIFAKLQ